MATLAVKVIPNARKSEINGWFDGDTLKIRLAAPPVDGKANQALITFLAAEFGVPKSRISIARGGKSRKKIIEIAGLSDENLRRSIEEKIQT